MSYGIYIGRALTATGIPYLAGYGDEPSSHWLEIMPRQAHPQGATITVGVTPEAGMPGDGGIVHRHREAADAHELCPAADPVAEQAAGQPGRRKRPRIVMRQDEGLRLPAAGDYLDREDRRIENPAIADEMAAPVPPSL